MIPFEPPGLLAGSFLLLTDSAGHEIPVGYMVAIAAVSVAVLFAFRFSQRKRSQEAIQRAIREAARSSEGEADRGKVREMGSTDRQDPELAKLYIELSEFARELEGRMNTKIAYLRQLLDEAERVVGELNGAIARAAGTAVPPVSPAASSPGLPTNGPPAPAAPAAAARTEAEAPAKAAPAESMTETPAEGPASSGTSAATAVEAALLAPLPGDPDSVPVPEPVPVPATAAAEPPSKPGPEEIQARILALAGEGKPKEAIAEALGIPKGEVDLVLRLDRASRKSAARPPKSRERPAERANRTELN
jgi:hypothetical protein